MGELLQKIIEKGSELNGEGMEGEKILLRSKPTLGILLSQINMVEVIRKSLTKGMDKKELERKLNEDYESKQLEIIENSEGYILFGPREEGSYAIAQSYTIYQKRE